MAFLLKGENIVKNFKRLSALCAAGLMATAGLVACSSDDAVADGGVYFLNFKPEQDAAYQKIAKAYTDKTGVQVKVVTAASNSYEQTLKAEIGRQHCSRSMVRRACVLGRNTWLTCLTLRSHKTSTRASSR